MNKKLGSIEELREILLPDSCDPNLQLPDPNLVQYYRDMQDRVYWMTGEIDASCVDLVANIIQWNREDKDTPVDERKPIRIIFNSPGGELETERMLVSIIEASTTPVYAIAIGQVASAASLIYLACHKHYATKNVTFLFHKGSIGSLEGMGYNEVQALMQDYKEQIEEMEKFYVSHTTFPEDVIAENLKSDWYVYIDEAVKNGVVDEVISDLGVLM